MSSDNEEPNWATMKIFACYTVEGFSHETHREFHRAFLDEQNAKDWVKNNSGTEPDDAGYQEMDLLIDQNKWILPYIMGGGT